MSNQRYGASNHLQARAEATKFSEALQAALASSGQSLLPLLRPWLQAYALTAAIAPQAVPKKSWQAIRTFSSRPRSLSCTCW